MDVEAQIARWIERTVIGLDLCPFAAPVWRNARVRIAVSPAASAEEAVQAVLEEAARLLETDAIHISTTLVVFAHALSDFETFLDAVATAEGALSEAGADGVLQVATFHPQYVFADQPPDAVANYTNRAPYPIMHLLRESEVADAVEQHPDPEGIPERNIRRLESLGLQRLRALLEEQ